MDELNFSYHHGGVSVPNLEASIAWYGAVLGFVEEKRFSLPHIPAEVVMIKNGDLRMELFQVSGAAPLPEARRAPRSDLHTHGNKHVAFRIDNIEAFGAALQARGADVVWIRRTPQSATIYIRDNAGNLIEFVEAPTPTGAPAALQRP